MENPNLRSKMKSKRPQGAEMRENLDYKIEQFYLFTEMDIAQNLAIRIGPKLDTIYSF